MSTEFYATIGVGISTLAFMSGFSAVVFFLFGQVNRRIDRLEDSFGQRFNRLEDKVDRIQEQLTDVDKRLLKVEWSLTFLATGRVRENPTAEDEEQS